MNSKQNIGEWTAVVDYKGKTPQINVDGTFPTDGEEPMYRLEKNTPQGINPTELLLTLVFGRLAKPSGKVNFSVKYNEALGNEDTYQTVLVVDEDSRVIAGIDVTRPKS